MVFHFWNSFPLCGDGDEKCATSHIKQEKYLLFSNHTKKGGGGGIGLSGLWQQGAQYKFLQLQ